MSDPQILKDLKPTNEFFIGIDSDGCVFDTMELKHKECFTPMFIKHFRLQTASKYAREVWDFVNLYSKSRGVNRFPAVVRALNLLRERKEVIARKVACPTRRRSKTGSPAKPGSATPRSRRKWTPATGRSHRSWPGLLRSIRRSRT